MAMNIEKTMLESNKIERQKLMTILLTAAKTVDANIKLALNYDITAGINVAKNGGKMDRFNETLQFLNDSKAGKWIAKLSRLPEYLGLSDCIVFDKKENCFQISNRSIFGKAVKKMTIPSVLYFDWINEQSAKKADKPVDLIARFKTIVSLIDKHGNGNFAAIRSALQSAIDNAQ